MTDTNPTPIAPPAHVPQWSYGEGIVTITPEPSTGLNEDEAPVELYSHAAKWVKGTGPSFAPNDRPALFGPRGKQRNIATMILLSIVTLGIYPLFWYRKINSEMPDFDPRMQGRSGWSVVALTIPWLLSALVVVGAGAYYLATLNGTDTSWLGFTLTTQQNLALFAAPLLAGILSLFVPFTVTSLVATGGRVRTIEDVVRTSPEKQIHPAAMVWAMIIPIIGWWIVMSRLQTRLNRAWKSTTDIQ